MSNEQLDGRIELGKAMWNAQVKGFYDCAAKNGVEAAEDLGALFAGFMAAAVGSMIGSIGPQYAMAVLDGVKKSCAAQTVEQYMDDQAKKIVIIGAGGKP